MTDDLGAILEYVDALRALDTGARRADDARGALRLPDARRRGRAVAAARRGARERPPARRQLLPGSPHRSRARRRRRGWQDVSRDRRARRDRGGDRRRACAAGKWLRARRRRAVPGSHRAPRRRARLLPAGRRRRARAGAADAVDAARKAGRDPGRAGRRAARASRTSSARAGVETTCASKILRGFVPPYESTVTARLAAAGARHARQAQHGRVRDGLVEREQRVQAGAQPLVARARAGRLVGRLRGRGRGVAVRGRDRHRHGRLDPAAGGAVRRRRHQADLRPRLALRRDRVRVVARSPGAVRPHRRGRGRAARGDGGRRPARRDQHPDAGGRNIARRRARAAKAVAGRAAGRSRPNTFSPGWTPRSRRRCARRIDELSRAGRDDRQGVAAAHEIRDRDLLPRLHRGGVVEPGALRRRPLRLSRAGARASLEEMYTRTRGEGFGAEPKRRIMLGAYVLRAGYYEAYYGKALRARRKIADDFAAAFAKCDAIVTPTSPVPAFKFGERMGDPLQMYLADVLTVAPEPGRHPGAVAALRLHQGGAADRPADHRAGAGRGDLFPRRRRLRGPHRMAHALPPEAAS